MCLCFNPCCNLDVVGWFMTTVASTARGYPYFPQCVRVWLKPRFANICIIWEAIQFYICICGEILICQLSLIR